MAHGDAREGKWRGNWRMEWVASTLHTTLEHGVPSITTADAHTSAVSSRLNWRPRRFKWTRPFRRKTKCGFCACAITFQTHSTHIWLRRDCIWSATFLHKSVAVRSVDWIFIVRVPAWRWLGEYVTSDKTFYSLLFKQEAVAAPVTAIFSFLTHSSKRPLLETRQTVRV
jgi:hypothetical protein